MFCPVFGGFRWSCYSFVCMYKVTCNNHESFQATPGNHKACQTQCLPPQHHCAASPSTWQHFSNACQKELMVAAVRSCSYVTQKHNCQGPSLAQVAKNLQQDEGQCVQGIGGSTHKDSKHMNGCVEAKVVYACQCQCQGGHLGLHTTHLHSSTAPHCQQHSPFVHCLPSFQPHSLDSTVNHTLIMRGHLRPAKAAAVGTRGRGARATA